LVLLGKIQASAPTLELALQNLNQKRDAVSRWLKALAADDLEFGEPRFPDQVEPDPMRMAQQMAQRRMRHRNPESLQDDGGKRSILVSYSAQWPIADKSSDEMLVLVDRIQFEAADLQDGEEELQEQPAAWEVDPVKEMQSLMSEMAPKPDGDEIHFLFLSCLTEAQREKALAEAFRDGHAKGAMTARAAGKELGDLQTAHWSPAESDALHGVHEMHRRTYFPLVAETPFRRRPDQVVHESPCAAEFVVSVHLTFRLK
jgi:hypothetical protein